MLIFRGLSYIELTLNIQLFIKTLKLLELLTVNFKLKFYSDNVLRRHIIAFIQKFTKGNKVFSQKYMKTIKVDTDIQFEDLEFSSGDYLLCSISNVKLYTTHNQNNKPTQNTQENQLIDVYLDLHKVYELFTTNNKMIMKTDDGRSYIYPTFDKYTEPIFTQGEIKY